MRREDKYAESICKTEKEGRFGKWQTYVVCDARRNGHDEYIMTSFIYLINQHFFLECVGQLNVVRASKRSRGVQCRIIHIAKTSGQLMTKGGAGKRWMVTIWKTCPLSVLTETVAWTTGGNRSRAVQITRGISFRIRRAMLRCFPSLTFYILQNTIQHTITTHLAGKWRVSELNECRIPIGSTNAIARDRWINSIVTRLHITFEATFLQAFPWVHAAYLQFGWIQRRNTGNL